MNSSPFNIPSGVKVHGQLPDFVIEDLAVDNLGVLTASVKITREYPLQSQWLLPWMAPAIFGGVPCTKIRAGLQDRTGLCNVLYTYEGVDPSGYQFPEDQAQCEVDCQTSATPIQTHPRFLSLVDKYAGKFDQTNKDDFLYFAKNLPKNLQNSDSGSDPDGNTGKKNPLYGVEQYELPRIIFRRTVIAVRLPDTLLEGVGFIDPSPGTLSAKGAQAPQLKGRANWLKAVLRASYRGNVWQIVTEWWASGVDGWNEDIYRRQS